MEKITRRFSYIRRFGKLEYRKKARNERAFLFLLLNTIMTSFKNILSPISVGRLLDVGTGRGSFIHTLIKTLKDYDEIIGIDNNPDYGSVFAESFADKPISYEEMDAYSLKFENNSFDTISISNSLHHLENPAQVLGEMQRVLKPGGTFIISEMQRDNLPDAQKSHVLMHHWGASINRAEGIYHNETYTQKEIKSFAEKTAIKNWHFYEINEFEKSPFDKEIIKEVEKIIDSYILKAKEIPAEKSFIEEGETIREHIRKVGFHGATTLVSIGIK
jgi:ubiquinone/menaquinone biosynthesis C-methylase UbiE